MYIRIHVIPSAKRELLTFRGPTEFDISVKEPAERNLANKRVVQIIGAHFKLPSSKVRIITGHRSRTKVLDVDV